MWRSFQMAIFPAGALISRAICPRRTRAIRSNSNRPISPIGCSSEMKRSSAERPSNSSSSRCRAKRPTPCARGWSSQGNRRRGDTSNRVAAPRLRWYQPAMTDKIREVYERYGFEPVETPAMEYTDALGKFLPDQDRPNEGVFSFQDDDEQWISLRYDLTAPLARYVAENFDSLPKPYRSYRAGYVYRNEKPGPGRFRQFMQFDADTVGAASMAADAEMCMLAADTMEALGIKRGDYVVKVNNRKVLDGVMEAIGIGGEENAGKRLTVLRAIDKLDRLGVGGVTALLGEGRKDESGDYTKGAGLSTADAKVVLSVVEQRKDWQETIAAADIYLAKSDIGQQGVKELEEIAKLVAASGYQDRIRIDPSVVRGLEYYTGPVYEVELTFEINDEKGRPVRFGSVGGGGRYDLSLIHISEPTRQAEI